ncbi:hypothetical protein [Photobacterium sp. J15]|uniref:hypothetical protein n=1 Tax=Photobacterium sp. J15 TaxID=265901 RepID=UPI0007E36A73|nr:hypothetical protein [Photobacterium sp. J15]
MKKSILGIMLGVAAFSGTAMADLKLDVTPQKNGAWVIVEKAGMPQEGVQVSLHGQSYTTAENGRVFVYSTGESARSVTIKATDEEGNSISTKALIPSNRS